MQVIEIAAQETDLTFSDQKAFGVSHLALKVALHPFADDLGQDAVRLLLLLVVLLLVFGIADHHLDHRGLKLR